MTAMINDKYIIRVTATDSTGIGIITGFLLNAKAYDALKNKHNFDVIEKHFKYTNDTEYYRINDLINNYLLEEAHKENK